MTILYLDEDPVKCAKLQPKSVNIDGVGCEVASTLSYAWECGHNKSALYKSWWAPFGTSGLKFLHITLCDHELYHGGFSKLGQWAGEACEQYMWLWQFGMALPMTKKYKKQWSEAMQALEVVPPKALQNKKVFCAPSFLKGF